MTFRIPAYIPVYAKDHQPTFKDVLTTGFFNFSGKRYEVVDLSKMAVNEIKDQKKSFLVNLAWAVATLTLIYPLIRLGVLALEAYQRRNTLYTTLTPLQLIQSRTTDQQREVIAMALPLLTDDLLSKIPEGHRSKLNVLRNELADPVRRSLVARIVVEGQWTEGGFENGFKKTDKPLTLEIILQQIRAHNHAEVERRWKKVQNVYVGSEYSVKSFVEQMKLDHISVVKGNAAFFINGDHITDERSNPPYTSDARFKSTRVHFLGTGLFALLNVLETEDGAKFMKDNLQVSFGNAPASFRQMYLAIQKTTNQGT